MTELLRDLAAGRTPRPRALVVPLVALTVLCLVVFSVGALARSDRPQESIASASPADAAVARTIRLEARNMSFYLSGEAAANPRLIVGRGERLRFVLSNQDPGMAHDLRIPSLGAQSELLARVGTSTELTLQAPQVSGEHGYLCSLHAQMMRGVLEVR